MELEWIKAQRYWLWSADRGVVPVGHSCGLCQRTRMVDFVLFVPLMGCHFSSLPNARSAVIVFSFYILIFFTFPFYFSYFINSDALDSGWKHGGTDDHMASHVSVCFLGRLAG